VCGVSALEGNVPPAVTVCVPAGPACDSAIPSTTWWWSFDDAAIWR